MRYRRDQAYHNCPRARRCFWPPHQIMYVPVGIFVLLRLIARFGRHMAIADSRLSYLRTRHSNLRWSLSILILLNPSRLGSVRGFRASCRRNVLHQYSILYAFVAWICATIKQLLVYPWVWSAIFSLLICLCLSYNCCTHLIPVVGCRSNNNFYQMSQPAI